MPVLDDCNREELIDTGEMVCQKPLPFGFSGRTMHDKLKHAGDVNEMKNTENVDQEDHA
jgi:hypothetical protein